MLTRSGVQTIESSHRGTALAVIQQAHGATAGFSGLYFERPYLVHVASGLTVSYSAQPGTGAGVRAHVFILWQQAHVGVNRLGGLGN